MEIKNEVGFDKHIKPIETCKYDCVCKLVLDEDLQTLVYFVKRNEMGGFCNPFQEDKIKDFDRVKPYTYELYINFLKTGNTAYLRKMEKEES